MFAALVATGGSACVGETGVQYGAAVTVDTPDLVEVSPGVQVIADYDEPVFFSDSFYWRNSGGVWYRSGTWGGGWVAYDRPPQAIVHIERPTAYAHYRPAGWHPRERRTERREPVRREEHREVRHEERREPVREERREPVREEHREERHEPARTERPAPAKNDDAAKKAANKAHH